MKKIEFTANFRSYRKGDTAVLPDNIAKVIIALKKGEYYKVKKSYSNRMLTSSPDATVPPIKKKRGRPSKASKIKAEEIEDQGGKIEAENSESE